MDNTIIPYGYDCYTFNAYEMRRFTPNIQDIQESMILDAKLNVSRNQAHQGGWSKNGSIQVPKYVRFTRKNEEYSPEQLRVLTMAGRLNSSDLNLKNPKQIFCGTKIQLGIGVVTNFLQMGLQYRRPIKGRSEIVNGSWQGIVSGLTDDPDKVTSYDVAFGNFLAYDEEFPYMKFGPFYAIESKLVLLTGSARRIEASSFGTNIAMDIWMIIIVLMFIMATLGMVTIGWQREKRRILNQEIKDLTKQLNLDLPLIEDDDESKGVLHLTADFLFIYFTMILNKPCVELDNMIWPRSNRTSHNIDHQHKFDNSAIIELLSKQNNRKLLDHFESMQIPNQFRSTHRLLPSSIRAISYIWSASCFIMASIYSGEMLAVILLHTDQNIDTINQLISIEPSIEPVIRQDDFTHNLMLKSLDNNMLKLHNLTKIVSRSQVYTREFIETVSKRERALLGDDELIETLYDIYSHQFPLYRSKTTYLQYPISIMYRNDLEPELERELRRGLVQIFEMGLLQRWNQAQKETLIRFYDKDSRRTSDDLPKATSMGEDSFWDSGHKYKPLSVKHFKSLFKLLSALIVVAIFVFVIEILYFHLTNDIECSQ